MILHIFKKDCRLLWLWILAVAIINLTCAGLWAAAGVMEFRGDGMENPYIQAAWIESITVWLASMGLIALAVHQDPLADPAPDCWTRPISRRDLILAKLLFALVAVQGPIFVGDFVGGLVLGFPPAAAATAAAVHWLALAGSLSVLAIAVAAVVRTLAMSMAVVVGWYVAFTMVWQLANPNIVMWPTYPTGLDWTVQAITSVLLIGGATLTLSLQYRSRQLWAARAGLAITLLMLALIPLLPLSARAAIQSMFAAGSQTTAAITLTVQRTAKSLESTQLFDQAMYGDLQHVLIPLKVSGLPAGAILIFDDAYFRFLDTQHRVLFERRMGRPLHVRAQSSEVQFDYPLTLPPALYQSITKQPLRIEVTYALTIAEQNAAYTITPAAQARHLQDAGWCKTHLTQGLGFGTLYLDMNCLIPGRKPVCVTTSSSHPSTPELTQCQPNYAPLSLGKLGGVLQDPIPIKRGAFPTRAQADATIALQTYAVADHLVRKIEIEVTGITERRRSTERRFARP
jgi:hypothetical protein